MRGSLVRRCKTKPGKAGTRCAHGPEVACRWAVVLDDVPQVDVETGARKRKQRWVTFRGTRAEAEDRLTELLGARRDGDLVDRTTLTLGDWLDRWLDERVAPALRPGTVAAYRSNVTQHIKPALGAVRLQELRPGHLTAYYLRSKLSRATLDIHHAILSSALRAAVTDRLLPRNVAQGVAGRPKAKADREEAKRHCWTKEEAARFIAAADAAGPQLSALFALALDSGMRKGELLALPWSAVDLDQGTVTIDRTLLPAKGKDAAKAGPVFGPTKTGKARTVNISDETVKRLTSHRRHQAELKMRNRHAYHDYGLVFAKEWGDLHGRADSLGRPLGAGNLGGREMARVLKGSGVRRIKFHGLRHTSATLLLAAGEPAHVVAARLGHSKVQMTLEVYAHALPAHGQQAARTIGGLLYGTGT